MRRSFAALLLCLALGAGGIALQSSYDAAITNVLKSEGGATYTNHPADPGGPTKYGVTLKDVRLYVDRNGTAETVRELSRDQALTIYHDKYWMHRCVRGDLLPAGVDYSIFDYAVNAGTGRPGVVLRRLLAVNTDRCDMSDALVAIVIKKDSTNIIRAIADERRRFYGNLIAARPSLGVFRTGWMARANSVEAVALRMAGGPPSVGFFGEEVEPEAQFGPGKAWERDSR